MNSPSEIPVRSHGAVVAYAIVDSSDFASLSQWSWHLHEGYAYRSECANGKKHRVSMHGQIAGQKVDHRNRNRLDNRRENLRPCTEAQNRQNTAVQANNTSGFRGVSRHAGRIRKPWQAYAQLDGKGRFLGYHETAEQAAVVASAFRARHMPFSEEAAA